MAKMSPTAAPPRRGIRAAAAMVVRWSMCRQSLALAAKKRRRSRGPAAPRDLAMHAARIRARKAAKHYARLHTSVSKFRDDALASIQKHIAVRRGTRLQLVKRKSAANHSFKLVVRGVRDSAT
eukprot:15471134-Alexandrium_andersonii.AAC.1